MEECSTQSNGDCSKMLPLVYRFDLPLETMPANKGPDGAESGEFCPFPVPRSRHFSVIFAQKLDFVNSDVVQIQPSRKVELGTIVCP